MTSLRPCSAPRTFWGDTGSLLLAFHLANKSADFRQLAKRPPIALDSTGEDYKITGLVQYDNLGRASLLHRTGAVKFEPSGCAHCMHLGDITVDTLSLSPCSVDV